MFAVLREGVLVAVHEERAAAEAVAEPGDEIRPATFGEDPGLMKLKVSWKLEKFEGDIQSPETLLETIEGEF